MSLDVYLELDQPDYRQACKRIFTRRDGATVEISREEWDRLYPDREPVVLTMPDELSEHTEVFSRNITHNLGKMAEEAGLYMACWRPDEIGINRAEQMIAPLSEGLEALHADPGRFKAFNPSNGWGNYEGLVAFVTEYLAACRSHPEAYVRVSR